VRELCRLAFEAAGLDWEQHVLIDERFLRPAEVDLLVGEPAKAHNVLGWRPEVDFPSLVTMMVEADMDLVRKSLT
jgi:GDPmannose 4,6-dehydratase